MTTPRATDADGRPLIDVRGPRFGAAITSLVLGTALVVQGPIGVGLVAWQWLAFAVAGVAGLGWSPYGNLFRFLKRRFDLGPPPATEAEGPPRFAQLCGLAVTTVALVLFALGAGVAGWVAVGIVLTLSVLLAAAGICVGCELYLFAQRLRGGTRSGSSSGGGSAGAGDDAPEPGRGGGRPDRGPGQTGRRADRGSGPAGRRAPVGADGEVA